VQCKWIYLIYSLLLVLNIVIISEEAVVTVQVMERLLVRVIKDRRHVPALRDLVSKVVRCHYTDVFRREASPTVTPRLSLASM
jgi:hypothetical protein